MKTIALLAAASLGVALTTVGVPGSPDAPPAAPSSWVDPGPPANPAMVRGPVDLVSAGPIAFAPDGTLFVGDSYGAQIWALDLEEPSVETAPSPALENVDGRVASMLGVPRQHLEIHDLAVSPRSRAVYLSVSRLADSERLPIKNRRLPGATAHLIRVDGEGMHEVPLADVRHQKADIRDVRAAGMNRWDQDNRAWSILEMSLVDGTLYVSGLSNEEWSAKLRRLPYPFREGEAESDAIRIFHTAHGRWETGAPARVFAPYEHEGEMRIFAGFSCTPLVDFSVAEMNEADRVDGKTIAELGAGNHVLDMISVRQGDETYFLLANHLHDFMRLARSDFDGAGSLTRPTNRAGIDRTPLPELRGVTRLDGDRNERVVMLAENDQGGLDLRTEAVRDLVR